MKKIALLLIGIMMQGCFAFDETEYIIDPSLQTYYENFIKEADKRGINIPHNNLIMKIEEGALTKWGGNGVTRKTKNQIYIYIDKSWYEKRGEKIELTIFHELGHAILNRTHNSKYSLMNSFISTSSEGWPNCISGNCRDFLIDELFYGK